MNEPGIEYADGRRNGDEAMASLARAVGVSLACVLETRAAGGMAGLGRLMIEHRGPHKCLGCGGSLTYANEWCRCGRSRPGESVRDIPVPVSGMVTGYEALEQLRERERRVYPVG